MSPAITALPSLAKLFWLSWPARFQLERCDDATALPRTASASGGIFGSATFACSSSLSKMSAKGLGFSVSSLRRLPSHVFSIVLSLEPAVAALAGVVFLHEHLHVRAWTAIGLVVVASAGAAGRFTPSVPPDA